MKDNEQVRKIVGKNVRMYRTMHHYTIETLANLLNITQGYLGLIERGERGLSYSYLLKLADIFGVRVDLFFVENDTTVKETDHFDDLQRLKLKVNKKLDLMDEAELHFILKMIMNLKDMRNPK